MKILKLTLAIILITQLASCKKTKKADELDVQSLSTLNKDILVDVSSNVIYATYTDMANKATLLHTSLMTFSTSSTPTNLLNAQQAWKDLRAAWEQSEGFLFGPVSVANIDPRLDTWPIDYARLDSVLASPSVFTATYIDGLEEALKGFHPLEYLLFGTGGTKTAAAFTVREKELLIALSQNVETLCVQVKSAWDPSLTGNYTIELNTAGSGSATYPTQRAAYEEILDAVIGICDEVANGKIKEPYINADPSLEESPYAKNSINDFTNNIRSVQNVYLGKYISDGKGLEDLIKSKNLAMDGQIKLKINNALNALANITVPFGDAITSQPVQVQNCINAINDLKSYLEIIVKPYVQTITN